MLISVAPTVIDRRYNASHGHATVVFARALRAELDKLPVILGEKLHRPMALLDFHLGRLIAFLLENVLLNELLAELGIALTQRISGSNAQGLEIEAGWQITVDVHHRFDDRGAWDGLVFSTHLDDGAMEMN